MALVKFYHLESGSWDDVSDLERNLQKYLLSEKNVRGVLESKPEDDVRVRLGEGDPTAIDRLVYDSGDFDVLYRVSREIRAGTKRFLRKDIPPVIGTDLVVSANPSEILHLQDYLGKSGFEVVEARTVSKATLSFGTAPTNEGFVKAYQEAINSFILANLEDVTVKMDIRYVKKWRNVEGHSGFGLISGDVLEVLQVRDIVRNGVRSYGTRIFEESVTFRR